MRAGKSSDRCGFLQKIDFNGLKSHVKLRSYLTAGCFKGSVIHKFFTDFCYECVNP